MIPAAPPWRLMTAAERRRYWFGYWRMGVPFAMTLGWALLMTMPVLMPVPVLPQLALLSVVVWATSQPGLMPPWVAFVAGLITDLLFAQPPGFDATIFALAVLVVRVIEARYVRHGHGRDWLVAAGLAVGHGLLGWWLLSLAARPVPLLPQTWQILTTIAAYPLVAWLSARVQRRIFG